MSSTIDQGLRDRVAREIDADLELGGVTARASYAAADRILALPEIAEALQAQATRRKLGHSISGR